MKRRTDNPKISGSDIADVPSRAWDGALEGVYRVAREIAIERGQALKRIKELLVAGNDVEALRLMRQFVGLPPVHGENHADIPGTRK